MSTRPWSAAARNSTCLSQPLTPGGSTSQRPCRLLYTLQNNNPLHIDSNYHTPARNTRTANPVPTKEVKAPPMQYLLQPLHTYTNPQHPGTCLLLHSRNPSSPFVHLYQLPSLPRPSYRLPHKRFKCLEHLKALSHGNAHPYTHTIKNSTSRVHL